ncbi:SMODS domain-containing nucleotidyltransferase [Sphaerotilus montanus]|uniref:SMODS domain-containing nucleotidyltransferase n=1 Tax=Sphaerotilus montanus TaxID=522889 RepID=UPI003FA2A63A
MAALSYYSTYPPILGRRASTRSSARLFYLVDAIGRLHEPTQTQLDALESSYLSTGEFLAECPEFTGQLHEVHSHGSRQLGTLVRPRDESREGFDIDLTARLIPAAMGKYEAPNGPVRLLNDLHAAVERYAKAHGLGIQRWERCVTLEYAGGMFADIAPVIDAPLQFGLYGDTLGRIPDRDKRLYELTNPRGYAKGFDKAAAISPVFTSSLAFSEALSMEKRADVVPLPDSQEVFSRLLSRLVQLLKLHRNVAFGQAIGGVDDLAPSSIFITTLAAAAYAVQAPRPHDSPLELLLDIVETLPDYFERTPLPNGGEHWMLANPSAPGENLASGMNTPARQAAFNSWHGLINKQLTDIVDAIERNAGMDVLLPKLEAAFGKRAAHAIRDEEARQRQSTTSIGRVALVSAGAAIATTARAHTFFGD